eukprot:156053-Alexandrium_andersonii.AAC.1
MCIRDSLRLVQWSGSRSRPAPRHQHPRSISRRVCRRGAGHLPILPLEAAQRRRRRCTASFPVEAH